MKRFLSMIVVLLAVVLVTGCKQSLTRESFVRGEAGGPWGYIVGTRELVRENVRFNLMMNVRIEPVTEKGTDPFLIGATAAVRGYFFYRVKPGRYTVKEWNVTGEDGETRTYPVNYVFEVAENTITYLGYIRFHQQGFSRDGREWISFALSSTNAMSADMAMLYSDIPEAKELKVINKAWNYSSER